MRPQPLLYATSVLLYTMVSNRSWASPANAQCGLSNAILAQPILRRQRLTKWTLAPQPFVART